MKRFISNIIFITGFFIFTSPFSSFSQAVVHSTTGYNVNIMVLPTSIIPSSNICTWGYNYNVKLNYSISLTGSNIPAALYTLQGYINCNSSMNFFDVPNNGGIGTVTSTSNQWNPNSDCNTVTVTSLHCNNASIEINGPGISAQTVSFPISYIPLPVQLVSFTAVPEGDKINVKWTTATEINNDHFTVERSADGVQWQEMKIINGAGNSTGLLNYQWLDEAPLAGTGYYRLKQTDIDRNISYSDIRTVHYSSSKDHISIYPVPNTGNTITLSGIPDYNNHELTVINGTGVNVFTTVLSSFSVSLPDLIPGIYILSVKNKLTGNTSNLRYIKL